MALAPFTPRTNEPARDRHWRISTRFNRFRLASRAVASDDDEGDARLSRLLGLIRERAGARLPTSSLGRLRRTASTALRAGADQLLGRIAGGTALD